MSREEEPQFLKKNCKLPFAGDFGVRPPGIAEMRTSDMLTLCCDWDMQEEWLLALRTLKNPSGVKHGKREQLAWATYDEGYDPRICIIKVRKFNEEKEAR